MTPELTQRAAPFHAITAAQLLLQAEKQLATPKRRALYSWLVTDMPQRLSVPEGCDYLRPSVVKERLESEFAYVATSEEAARHYYLSTFRKRRKYTAPGRHFVDDVPISPIEELGAGALYVQCGDDLTSETMLLGMFVIPGEPIVVDYTSPENERLTLPLIERCAAVLGYQISGD